MAYNRGKKVPTFDLEFVTINIWKHSQKLLANADDTDFHTIYSAEWYSGVSPGWYRNAIPVMMERHRDGILQKQ